jgi:hypothetical protein
MSTVLILLGNVVVKERHVDIGMLGMRARIGVFDIVLKIVLCIVCICNIRSNEAS